MMNFDGGISAINHSSWLKFPNYTDRAVAYGMENSPGLWPKGVWDPRLEVYVFQYVLAQQYEGPARGHLASNFVPSISLKPPLKIIKINGFLRFYKHFSLTGVGLFALV